jgi:hypothetical protein
MAMSSFNDFMLVTPDVLAPSVDQNNVPVTSSITVFIPTANIEVTGFESPSAELSGLLFVANGSPTFTITLPNDDAGSLVGNRIVLVGGTVLTLNPGQSAILVLLPGIGWRPIILGAVT